MQGRFRNVVVNVMVVALVKPVPLSRISRSLAFE